MKAFIKDGVQWLKQTSQSCFVIAALIASVAYAQPPLFQVGTINNGIPILKGDPSFDTFINASLVALCFSVTSLTMFLSILTANSTIHDLLHNLPTSCCWASPRSSSQWCDVGLLLVLAISFNMEIGTGTQAHRSLQSYACPCLPTL
ncbi:ankyrin repeat protein [Cinnamomum micranthum f. kanehirae]|uniref:Ankyrin repeat protein n=1 Tax=Cinnamomum micranthum f. kanehirae TaxID=337451 RepID=A0A3S3MFW8_9MAGN|nr:ankyrin repeat protein [Cinnamomum micranthum f. kanehirae]